MNTFLDKGWRRFDHDPTLAKWVRQTLPAARDAVRDPRNARWLRCGGTWFAGVNALRNDPQGAVTGGPALAGNAIDFIRGLPGSENLDWDQAQLSTCYPGYPRPMASETPAAYRYRHDRDAAHVDGLLPEGPTRRRHLREYHRFLLGIPMTESSPDAAPFVVWEGSHEMVREALSLRFADRPPENWGHEDITAAYHRIRKRVFERCKRTVIHARPGEAYLVHRLALHGIAPWGDAADASADGRMICYFRPAFRSPRPWLREP